MKKLNFEGFGIAETLIGIAVLGLIGSIGWYVFNKQQNDPQTNTKSMSQTSDAENSNQENKLSNPDFTYQDVAIPSEWKTYDNQEYGFSFKYPANFILGETNLKTNESADAATFAVGVSAPNGQGVCEVRVLKTNLDTSVKNDPLNINGNAYKDTIEQKNITNNGYSAIELSYNPGGKISWFFVEKDNSTTIRFSLVEDSGDNAQESKAVYNSLQIQ